MSSIEEMEVRLKAPLDASKVKDPPQGKHGQYVEGLHSIREANEIFGHFGWSYSVTRLELSSRIEVSGNLRISYICSVKVVAHGASREGVAAGSGIGKPANEADLHDSAIKEAETDALKRALRTFGNTFGLALYEKDKSRREVATTEEMLQSDLVDVRSASDLNEVMSKHSNSPLELKKMINGFAVASGYEFNRLDKKYEKIDGPSAPDMEDNQ